MSSSPNGKSRSSRPQKLTALTVRHSFIVWCVAFVVAGAIAVSLLVAVGAIREKARMVRGASQILDLVDMSRRLAESEHAFGATGREDILRRLAQMGQIQVENESNGLKALMNPWGGTLVAYTIAPDSRLKMETIVTPRVCARIIGMLTENMNALGLRQIDTRGLYFVWRTIYDGGGSAKPGKNQIAAGCQGYESVTLALTFSLR
jgi:hypothetical protein